MDLIPIQKDLLVNVDKISTVKLTRDAKGQPKTVMVTVENKNHTLEVPLDDFLRRMKESGVNLNEQFWSV